MGAKSRGKILQGRKQFLKRWGLNFVRALGQTWWVAGKMLVGG